MSINQFSSEIPQTVWWAWQQQPQHQPAISLHSSAFKFPQTGQTQSSSSAAAVPMFCGENREPMFQKTLTPSDVGKLNRLVIPKQHAEKYFPLSSFSGAEATTEKGLLLTFEDELGKCWRFRYSYWNSSQSYVLTRGWSRFVKEKRLDAGDIVTFDRGGDRLFIGWRRRVLAAPTQPPPPPSASETVGYYHAHPSYTSHPQTTHDHSYLIHSAGTGGDDDHEQETRQHTQTTSSSGVNQRRSVLRLFGVNMECHEADNMQDDDQEIDDGSETLTRPDSAHSTDHHHPLI